MKKWIGLGVMLSLNVYAHDISVEISGKIKDGTCDIVQNDREKEVQLGDYRLQDLTQVDLATPLTEFSIGLEHCGQEAREVRVAFQGNSPAAKPELLALTSESVAQLGIRILDKDKNTIALNNTQDGGLLYALPPGQDTNTLTFYAQYVVLSTPVSAGPANGTASLILTWP